MDGDEAAGTEVERLIETGLVVAFESHEQLQEWVGGASLIKVGDDNQGERWQDQAQTHIASGVNNIGLGAYID